MSSAAVFMLRKCSYFSSVCVVINKTPQWSCMHDITCLFSKPGVTSVSDQDLVWQPHSVVISGPEVMWGWWQGCALHTVVDLLYLDSLNLLNPTNYLQTSQFHCMTEPSRLCFVVDTVGIRGRGAHTVTSQEWSCFLCSVLHLASPRQQVSWMQQQPHVWKCNKRAKAYSCCVICYQQHITGAISASWYGSVESQP